MRIGRGSLSTLADIEAEEPWTVEFSTEAQVRRPWKLLQQIGSDLLESRSLAVRLFWRNLSATHRQTLLGWLWVLIPTLLQAGSWAFLVRENVLRADGIPGSSYIAFVAIGTTLWQAFFEALQAPLKAVASNQSLVSKLRFPREALVLVGLLEVFFDFCIRMVAVLLIAAAFGVTWSPLTALVPIFAVALIVFGNVIGLWLTPIGMLYQDIPRMLIMLGPLWMLMTPVVYPPPQNAGYQVWTWLNPPAGLLSVTRDLLTVGWSEMWGPALLWLALAPLAATLALIWFRIAFRIVIERVAN